MPHEDPSRVYWTNDIGERLAHERDIAALTEKAKHSPQAAAFFSTFVDPDLHPRLYEPPEWPRVLHSFIDRDGDEVRASINAAWSAVWYWTLDRFTLGSHGLWYRAPGAIHEPLQYLPGFERSLECVEVALREQAHYYRRVFKFTSQSRYQAWILASVGPRHGGSVVRFWDVYGDNLDVGSAFPFEIDAGDIVHLRVAVHAIAEACRALADIRRAAGQKTPSDSAVPPLEYKEAKRRDNQLAVMTAPPEIRLAE